MQGERHIRSPQRFPFPHTGTVAQLFSFLLAAGCLKATTEPAHPQTRSTSAPPAADAEVLPQSVVAVWERLASQAGVRRDIVSRTSGLILEAMAHRGAAANRLSLEPYERSLRLFLSDYAFALKESDNASGTDSWLALCTAEALAREPLAEAQSAEVLADYRIYVTQMEDTLTAELLKHLGRDNYDLLKAEIEVGARRFRETVCASVEALQRDFLCPAYKKPLSEDWKRIFLDDLRAEWKFPKHSGQPIPPRRKALVERDVKTCLEFSTTRMRFRMFCATENVFRRYSTVWPDQTGRGLVHEWNTGGQHLARVVPADAEEGTLESPPPHVLPPPLDVRLRLRVAVGVGELPPGRSDAGGHRTPALREGGGLPAPL